MIEKVESFIKAVVVEGISFKATSYRFTGDPYLHVSFRALVDGLEMALNIGDDGNTTAIVLKKHNYNNDCIESNLIEVEREYAINVVNRIIFKHQ